MRYKLLCCALVLLIATPFTASVLAQEFSPIIIKTGDPTPTVVRSGEPFKVTYRAMFFDTVIINEEEMQPSYIGLEEVEVINLEISPSERLYDDSLGYVNVKDFTYTFMIIKPEKKMYKIPPINFVWVEKKAGTPENEATEKEEPRKFLTDEVTVNYITTAVRPPKPQPLDVRDKMVFVSPVPAPDKLRLWAYSVLGVASLLALVVVYKFSGYSKVSKSQESVQVNDEVVDGETTVQIEPILLPKQARKKFLKELRKLRNEDQLASLEKKFRLLVRNLLLAECQGLVRNSMSENEIFAKLESLSENKKKAMKRRYGPILELARRLKKYGEEIDSETYSLNPGEEIDSLRLMALNLETGFLKRLWLHAQLRRKGQ